MVAISSLAVLWLAVGGPETLDLAALLAEVQANDPEILAARERAEAAAEQAHEAGAPADPQLSVGYTNEGLHQLTLGEALDSALALTWTQQVRRGDKRRAAERLARDARDVRLAEIDVRRFAARETVTRLYAELWRLDRTRALLADSRHILAAAADATRARYEVGEGTQETVLRAQAEMWRLDAEIAHAERERRTASFALSAALGRPEQLPLLPAGELPELTVAEEALPGLAEEAALAAPAVFAARERARQGASAQEAARLELRPDLSWSAGYANRGGLDPLVSASVGVPLPLHRSRRQRPGLARAEHEAAAALHELASAEIRARSAARDLADEALHSGELVRLYATVIVPSAQSTLDAARASFEAGQAELRIWLEDFQRLLAARGTEISERAHRVQAAAALEALLARPLLSSAHAGARP